MSLRRDALTAAAEMVLAVEDLARASDDAVATVGAFTAQPGAVNVIAGEANFTVDLRSPSNAVCDDIAGKLCGTMTEIAARRGVQVAVEETHAMPSVACAEQLIGALGKAVDMTGHVPVMLPSGAGHDAMAMASLCATGMLFVRCQDGLSHHPDEAIAEADAHACVEAILHFIRMFKPVPNAGASPAFGLAD